MKSTLAGRAIKYVNTTISVLLAAVLGLIYWFAWRPVPQRSGTIQAPATASVSFDTLGVPHIRAASLADALFVQGYVTAQDRLFQMDILRRLTAGELAEVFGPVALDSDREIRRLRLRRIAEEAYTTLSPEDRAAFAAYSRGVNHYIATHRGRLALEFTLAGYEPRPWSVVDGLLICLNMFRDLTMSWRDELVKRSMLAEGHPDKVNFLYPTATGDGAQPGSNAWALAGSRTASGKPLLSNDMHLEFSIPGIWYMTHLQAPDLDVAGVALPGAPGIISGHNRRIAWGITNLHYDVQDLYIEKLDERTGHYQIGGEIEQARPERELIRVKGKPPVEVQTWITRHGPLFVQEGGDRMVLRWVAGLPGLVEYPILDINRAQNWEQFLAALKRFPGPGQNFVYADVDGNIGYHAAGKLPKRRGYAGDVPVDGSANGSDWDGFIPFEELPSAFNPPDGMIITANQNPFPANFPYSRNGNFAPPQRYRQLHRLLSARKDWKAEDLLSVQTDVYSELHHYLALRMLEAYGRKKAGSPQIDAAVALLRGWNGQMDKDLGAPVVMALAYRNVRTAAAELAAPGRGAAYEFSLAAAAIEHLLRQQPAGWFRDYDEMLLRALADAVDEATRMQGRDIARWRYGNYLRVRIDHPVIHQVPFFGRYFDIGPVPMSGSALSVKQTTLRLAPSMRMNADLGDWDHSLLNIPVGQSGHILSSHYRDQWKNYYAGRGFPMQFLKVDAHSQLQFQPSGK